MRKQDHLSINLEKDVSSGLDNGLAKFHLIHCALPEIDLAEVDTQTSLFGRNLSIPLLISSMSGGTSQAAVLNRQLAEAAQMFKIAMGVGSQRIGIEQPDLMDSFKVRKHAPDILLFANLGAIQLNYSYTIEHCKAAIDALEADSLILHLNPLQEALMEHGNTNFSGLLEKIEKVCKTIRIPVVIKEVGWGVSVDVAKKLVQTGVSAIDVAGAGGTSWSEVEKYRSKNEINRSVAAAFREWGLPTAEALVQIHAALPKTPLIASGGIRNGMEAAKCLALGANLVGMARPFLLAAAQSEQAMRDEISIIQQQLRISMFCTGAKTIAELKDHRIQKVGVE